MVAIVALPVLALGVLLGGGLLVWLYCKLNKSKKVDRFIKSVSDPNPIDTPQKALDDAQAAKRKVVEQRDVAVAEAARATRTADEMTEHLGDGKKEGEEEKE